MVDLASMNCLPMISIATCSARARAGRERLRVERGLGERGCELGEGWGRVGSGPGSGSPPAVEKGSGSPPAAQRQVARGFGRHHLPVEDRRLVALVVGDDVDGHGRRVVAGDNPFDVTVGRQQQSLPWREAVGQLDARLPMRTPPRSSTRPSTIGPG
eukprot:5796405-Prymnesium_polylepis.1